MNLLQKKPLFGKLVKQRRDSVAQYNAAGATGMAAKEQIEIDVLSVYLPKQMTDDGLYFLVGHLLRQ